MFGFLKGLSVTLGQLPRKKVTIQYPDVQPEWPERFRGVHRFIPEDCIVCNQCARICPTNCISLSGTRDENKKLRIDTYDINFDICILCGLCTEVCPTECIQMSDTFELADYSRESLYLDMHWLYENQLRYERRHPERVAAQAAGEEAPAQ
jgi:NADH-quinone oxidoreductase subunit I